MAGPHPDGAGPPAHPGRPARGAGVPQFQFQFFAQPGPQHRAHQPLHPLGFGAQRAPLAVQLTPRGGRLVGQATHPHRHQLRARHPEILRPHLHQRRLLLGAIALALSHHQPIRPARIVVALDGRPVPRAGRRSLAAHPQGHPPQGFASRPPQAIRPGKANVRLFGRPIATRQGHHHGPGRMAAQHQAQLLLHALRLHGQGGPIRLGPQAMAQVHPQHRLAQGAAARIHGAEGRHPPGRVIRLQPGGIEGHKIQMNPARGGIQRTPLRRPAPAPARTHQGLAAPLRKEATEMAQPPAEPVIEETAVEGDRRPPFSIHRQGLIRRPGDLALVPPPSLAHYFFRSLQTSVLFDQPLPPIFIQPAPLILPAKPGRGPHLEGEHHGVPQQVSGVQQRLGAIQVGLQRIQPGHAHVQPHGARPHFLHEPAQRGRLAGLLQGNIEHVEPGCLGQVQLAPHRLRLEGRRIKR